MYIVLWDSSEVEFEYLFDAEELAASLPGSEVWNLELDEEVEYYKGE